MGYETRSYSGRGMFGKECLGITVDNPLHDVQEIAYQLGLNNGDMDAEPEEIIKLPKSVSWDQMGTRYIVYWPQVPYNGGDEC